MPIYEYRCDQCDKTHEVIQKFSDSPLDKCPDCNGPVQKIMSLTSFHLKGSGWYATDYKKSGSSPASPASPSKETTKEAPKAETKPVSGGSGKGNE